MHMTMRRTAERTESMRMQQSKDMIDGMHSIALRCVGWRQ